MSRARGSTQSRDVSRLRAWRSRSDDAVCLGRFRDPGLDSTACLPRPARALRGLAGAASATPIHRASCWVGSATRSLRSSITPCRSSPGATSPAPRWDAGYSRSGTSRSCFRGGFSSWPASASRSNGRSSRSALTRSSSPDSRSLRSSSCRRSSAAGSNRCTCPAGTSSAVSSSRCWRIRWATSCRRSCRARRGRRSAGCGFTTPWVCSSRRWRWRFSTS